MSLADLTLDHWSALDLPAARRLVQRAADVTGGRLVAVERSEGDRCPRARISWQGREFALVPGGTATLGFDLDAWEPAPEQAADYRTSLDEGFGLGDDLEEHLSHVLSPPRTVTLATVLMAVEDERLTEAPADVPAALAAQGLRMPSPDEWEHACGAGARTLFRWGGECPLDVIPYHHRTGPQHRPNALGLRIAYDTYRSEVTSDPTAVYGGDGGESVCGGYGTLLAWLPLATANRNHPEYAEFVHGPDGEDMYEEFSVRPVLDL